MRECLCFFDGVVDAVHIFQQGFPLLGWEWDALFARCPFAVLLKEFTNVHVCLPFEWSNCHAPIFGQLKNIAVFIFRLLCLLHWCALYMETKCTYFQSFSHELTAKWLLTSSGPESLSDDEGAAFFFGILQWKSSNQMFNNNRYFSSQLLLVFRCEIL